MSTDPQGSPTPMSPGPGGEKAADIVTIADEVAAPVQEALNAAEKLTNAGIHVPFALARTAVDKLRVAADALEMQIRKAGPGPKQ